MLTLFTLFGLGIFLRLPAGARVNRASLAYFAAARLHRPLTHLSQDHPRRTLWLAVDALNEGRTDRVLALMEPLASTGNQFAMQITATTYESQGHLGPALHLWQQLRNTYAVERIAEKAQAAEQRDIALAAYQAYRHLEPVQGTARLARFYEREMNDLVRAEAVLRQALADYRHSRGRPYWLRVLATNLIVQERWPDAINVLEQLVPLYPKMYKSEQRPERIYVDLAQAYYDNRQSEDALAALQRVLTFEHTAYVLPRAAQLYEELGHPQQAISIYQEMLDRNPDNTVAREAINRLQPAQP